MKNHILLLSLLCPLFLFGQNDAQNLNFLWGDLQKDSRMLTPYGLIGYDDTGVYTMKVEKSNPSIYTYHLRGLILEHYDNKMNLTKSYPINPKAYSKRKPSFEQIIQIGRKLYLFLSFKHKGDNTLYVQGIDKQTLKPTPDLKKIAKINYRGSFENNKGYFDCQIARDSSKILIYYQLPLSNQGEERFGFHVYDGDFNLLWEKGVTLPYENRLFHVNDYKIDNEGNVYLSGKLFERRPALQSSERVNHSYRVVGFFQNGEEVRQYEPTLQEKYITSMIMVPDTSSQYVICSGFYADKRNLGISGSYFIKIDNKTQKISVNKNKPFEVNFMTQNMKKSDKNRVEKRAETGKDIGLKDYYLKLIWHKTSGNITLIGEQYNGFSPGYYNRRLTYARFNHIIVINMSPDGEVRWVHKIPKRQIAADGKMYALSHAYSADIKDKLYFIFNDLPKNLSLTDNEVPELLNGDVLSGNLRQSVVSLVEIDESGKKTKKALFSADQADTYIQPIFYRYTRNNEMILLGKKGDKHRYIKVILDK